MENSMQTFVDETHGFTGAVNSCDSRSSSDWSSPSRRSLVRDMSADLLQRVCLREAHDINRKLAPHAEPLVRERTWLRLPKFSNRDIGKSPHFFMPSPNDPQQSKSTNLFFADDFSMCDIVPTTVDLTEPPFEDFSEASINYTINCSEYLNNNSYEKTKFYSSRRKGFGMFDISMQETSKDSIGSDLNDRSSFNIDSSSASSSLNLDNFNHPSPNGKYSRDAVGENFEVSSLESGFQLFESKLKTLLMVPESRIQKAVEKSWRNLSSCEQTAFEMQRHVIMEQNTSIPANTLDCYHLRQRMLPETLPDCESQKSLSFNRCANAGLWNDGYYGQTNLTSTGECVNNSRDPDFEDKVNFKKSRSGPLQIGFSTKFKNSAAAEYSSPFCSTTKISWDAEAGEIIDGRKFCTGRDWHSMMSSSGSSTMLSSVPNDSLLNNDEIGKHALLQCSVSEEDSDTTFDESNSSIVSIIRRPL